MSKKIIQVPVDDDLLSSLDSMARSKGQSRSGIIREACLRYLKQTESEKFDEAYRRGYERMPESPALGNIQASLAGRVLEKESW
jgi:metal-responsive CopG/Arc/MetJ family transcriptional regulator